MDKTSRERLCLLHEKNLEKINRIKKKGLIINLPFQMDKYLIRIRYQDTKKDNLKVKNGALEKIRTPDP